MRQTSWYVFGKWGHLKSPGCSICFHSHKKHWFAARSSKGSLICMQAYFEAEKGLFLSILRLSKKHTKLIKKKCIYKIVSKDSFTFWTKFEFSWQMITALQLFHCCSYYKNALSESQNCRHHHHVNEKRMLFGHLQGVNRGQSWTKSTNFG